MEKRLEILTIKKAMKDNKNKKIGGVGPQASSYLYDKIMKLAQEKHHAKNNHEFPELILYSIPVPDFISNKERISEAMEMFENVIKDFNKINVNYITIASNTVHLLLDDFQKISNAKFISMIDAVFEQVKNDSRTKIGLLSSPMTIESNLYKKYAEKENIELLYPLSDDLRKVESMIRAIISGTNNREELKRDYIQVTQKLFDQAAEAIILGCTELPLAINYEAINHKIYNSMDILAEKITDIYYQ